MKIKERIEHINSRIEAACLRSGRNPLDVKLLAVTKNHDIKAIEELLDTNLKTIAENKVQESLQKIPALSGLYSEFHFIGHLQSNKLRKILSLSPTLIHSLDSISTIRKMDVISQEDDKVQDILIQVNTSGEESKSGIEPETALDFIKDCASFTHIRICGLMTIGKLTDKEEEIRECFIMLRNLFEKISLLKQDNVEMQYLSMGMSGDFEIAIEEGANILRIGSAIMGPRNY